ncbi:transposase [Bradyrhizobium japonicum]|nr:transposase [Bradyrhizobium japonicum]WLB23780.1 transposase [Bradyrhizobium japonicum]
MKADARVCDVARRYGVKAQQLTTWRRLARVGRRSLAVAENATMAPIGFVACTVRSATGVSVGAVVSVTLMVNVSRAEFPAASIAVAMAWLPRLKMSPE